MQQTDNKELQTMIGVFNNIKIDQFCSDNDIPRFSLKQEDIDNVLFKTKGPADLGAVYRWPRESGGKVDVYGFGLIETQHGVKFIAAHNSRKKGGMRFVYLDPVHILKMIEHGEVEYFGNILDPEFRKKKLDWEKTSLSICGFLAAYEFSRKNKETKVDDILERIESGQLSLDEALNRAGMDKGLFED